MPTVEVYNQQAQKIGRLELDPKVFDVSPRKGLIEQAITTLLANRRQPLAHTKTKGEVRGGGRKPWRQKGTGRARHGSIRSPQWKGGGVVHGPRSNRNFEIKLNTQARRKALAMSLTDKLRGDRLTVIDSISLPKPKTKEFAAVLKAFPANKSNLIILPSTDQSLVRAGRNIPGVTFIRGDSLNTYDVVRHDRVFVMKEAVPVIVKTYAKA